MRISQTGACMSAEITIKHLMSLRQGITLEDAGDTISHVLRGWELLGH